MLGAGIIHVCNIVISTAQQALLFMAKPSRDTLWMVFYKVLYGGMFHQPNKTFFINFRQQGIFEMVLFRLNGRGDGSWNDIHWFVSLCDQVWQLYTQPKDDLYQVAIKKVWCGQDRCLTLQFLSVSREQRNHFRGSVSMSQKNKIPYRIYLYHSTQRGMRSHRPFILSSRAFACSLRFFYWKHHYSKFFDFSAEKLALVSGHLEIVVRFSPQSAFNFFSKIFSGPFIPPGFFD